MATVTFTSHLQRHVDCPRQQVAGATLGEALERVFERNPKARGYVLDDQGGLREHVAVFIDGQRVRDRRTLADPLAANAQVHVLQALTGG